MDSAEPLSSILWTLTPHPGESAAAGTLLLPRAWGNIGFRCPVQVAYRHFDVRIGCYVFGFGLFAFQTVLFGLYRTFFIIGWKKRRCLCSFNARFFDYR